MKRLIIPVLSLVLSNTNAQVYFDTLFDAHDLTETLKNAVSYDSGYLFAMRSRNQTVDTAVIVLIAMDEHGNEYRRTEFNAGASTHTFGQLNQHPVSGHVFFNSIGTPSLGVGYDFGLIRYNDDGDVVWWNRYGETDRNDICYHGIICNDMSYALVGQSNAPSGNTADIMLVKVDSSGNEQWRKYYGGSNYEGAGYHGVIQSPDSGFIICGWTMSYGAGQRDWYLVKTDSLGNQQWQKTYGDANNQSGSCIIPISDGNYLMCGGAGNGAARMIKIDPSGTVIWEYDYAHPEGTGSNYLFKVIELVDGSLVATGLSNNTSQSDAGWLLKTDSDGIELWQRRYNKNNNTDLFYSVLLANDGGFLLSGQARNAETNSQDAWLLKVDSVGCPYPNCTVGVDEVETGKVVVDVWPNPAQEAVRLQVTGYSKKQELQLTVTDMQGRSYSPPSKEGLGVVGPYHEIDVSLWPNGLYIFTITNGQERARVRVVVQH